MSKLTEKISYVKGLAEGMQLNAENAEGKIIYKLLDLLEEADHELNEIRKAHNELDEYVESIDDDLCDIEDYLFGDDDDDDDDDDDSDWDAEDGEDEDDEEDDGVVEYVCPHCGARMTFDLDSFGSDEDYLCPNCHKPVFPEDSEE